MKPLSQAPVEKKEKKYDFKEEVTKEENRFTKEKVLKNIFFKSLIINLVSWFIL